MLSGILILPPTIVLITGCVGRVGRYLGNTPCQYLPYLFGRIYNIGSPTHVSTDYSEEASLSHYWT